MHGEARAGRPAADSGLAPRRAHRRAWCGWWSMPHATASRRPVAVCALGGYGRREPVPALGHRSAAPRSAAPSAGETSAFVHALPQPAVGSAARRRASRPRALEDFGRPRDRQPGVPARAARRAADRRRRAAVRAVRRGLRPRATHAQRARCAAGRSSRERHAHFNDTLYQLEPDVKDAPGGAARPLRRAHDRACSPTRCCCDGGRGATRRVRRRRRLSAARALDAAPRGRARPQRPHATSCRSASAEMLGYAGTHAAAARRALMGDYFRHARAVDRSLASGAARRARAGRPRRSVAFGRGDGVRFVDRRARGASAALWLGAFQAALDRAVPRCPTMRSSCIAAARRSVHAPTTSSPTAGDRDCAAASS